MILVPSVKKVTIDGVNYTNENVSIEGGTYENYEQSKIGPGMFVPGINGGIIHYCIKFTYPDRVLYWWFATLKERDTEYDRISLITGGGDCPDVVINNGLGDSWEVISKNLNDYDKRFAYIGDNIDTITYTTDGGDIIKTFSYSGDNIDTIVFSGAGYPTLINTTKTFVYSGDNIATISYT